MNRSRAAAGIASKHNEASALVAQMTLPEKAAFASGRNFWNLEACERLGVPSVMVTDGPHGLRKQSTSSEQVGLQASVPATCFPTASALAASWDPQLLLQIGVALGEQCAAENVAVLLGPGMNIKRHPLCGRNFEYFSEDPLLTGELAAALIKGVQSEGVGTSVKHFAVNNQEQGRMCLDAVVDERTLREIYLRGFEIAVRNAQPWTVMCAYNRVNGTYCSEHEWLLGKVLRDEWGFQGLVMTDWGAANDRVRGVASGLDLEMPSSGGVNDARIEQAIIAGHLAEAQLDRSIVRNVSLALCGGELASREVELDQAAHHKLAQRAAVESAVLLKNTEDLLPLPVQGRIGVIGAFAKAPRYQGTGSSQVTPTRLECAFDAICELLEEQGEVVYAPGYEPVHSPEDDVLLQAAVAVAASVDVAIVFAGLPVTYESEGFDRDHMDLPAQHNRLIEAVSAANRQVVVVLNNGSPVAMPWLPKVGAVLEAYLGGQAGGSAAASLLFGLANPSGKLAETFPLRQSDVAADQWFPGESRQVQYREGLYVGYRYFDSARLPVLFPFGHGLSYTSFSYSELTAVAEDDGYRVRVTVTNCGEQEGAEVVQWYVHDVDSTAYRPEQELRGYAKVVLAPGQSQAVSIHLDQRAFAFYDVNQAGWVVEAGLFELRVGASSRDIRLRVTVELDSAHAVSAVVGRSSGPDLSGGACTTGDEAFALMLGHSIPAADSRRPFHVNSTLQDLTETWLGRQVKSRVEAELKKNLGFGQGDDPTLDRMFNEMVLSMPLRAFPLFSRGKIGMKPVRVLIALLNGELARAARILIGGQTPW